jgi:hypothetical protein
MSRRNSGAGSFGQPSESGNCGGIKLVSTYGQSRLKEVHMRIIIATALFGTALTASPLPLPDTRPSDSLERPFAANGRIRMDLSAGEYRITGAADDRIRMQWSVQEGEDVKRVRARADVRGTEARVTTDGPMNHFKVAIQVPARADLYIRLTAGDISIKHVEGNKDVELHAGEIDIDAGRTDDYNRVDASVWAGELHASPFGATREGLFRSFDWSGKGRYRLHAKLKAGEIRIRASSPAS